jgi:hypothetical protein
MANEVQVFHSSTSWFPVIRRTSTSRIDTPAEGFYRAWPRGGRSPALPHPLTVEGASTCWKRRSPAIGARANALLYLAVAGFDRETGKAALDHVGDKWDPYVWKERLYFDRAVLWAGKAQNWP